MITQKSKSFYDQLKLELIHYLNSSFLYNLRIVIIKTEIIIIFYNQIENLILNTFNIKRN